MSENNIFRFRKFDVYRTSLEFRKYVKVLVTSKFPNSERYILTTQTLRAVDSILLNIAEGSEKYSDLNFSRYLNMSLGSLNEVVACLDLARQDNYINDVELKTSIEKATIIYKQLRSFSSKVRSTKA